MARKTDHRRSAHRLTDHTKADTKREGALALRAA
jgi:hypothetical protein